jgi:lipopolysaccharide transport system ATP-binding protein
MSEVAIAVEGVSKRFMRQDVRARRFKDVALRPRSLTGRRDPFWALQDVNVEVRVGETLGLIGANGSGKSTLLKLIGKLGLPTRGRIVRHREIEAMLSLGEGLNPLLTARENAVTAGILANQRRREITRKLDEIAAFAELEEFFDRPLRTYSDGMRLRLAFSVAVSSVPEVLMIDEVLTVGDLRFQEKCFARLEELRQQGTTLIIASHVEDQVQRLCNRVLWLAHGRVQALGPPEDVLEAYRKAMDAETERRAEAISSRGMAEVDLPSIEGASRSGTLEVEIAAVRLLPSQVRTGGTLQSEPIVIEVDLLPHVPADEPIVGVSLHRVSDYTKVLDVTTDADGVRLGRVDRPQTVTLTLDRLDLEPGSYRFDVGVYERNWAYVYDYHWHAYPLEIVSAGGGFGPSRRWSTGG